MEQNAEAVVGARSRDEQDAWGSAAGLAREPARTRWFVPGVLALTALSVPFYWWGGTAGLRWFGMPAWVWATVACSAGVSAVTAWAALRRWREGDEP